MRSTTILRAVLAVAVPTSLLDAAHAQGQPDGAGGQPGEPPTEPVPPALTDLTPAAPTDDVVPVAAGELDLLRGRVRDLEDRLDEVETRTQLQRLEWSADYRTTLAGYWYHGASPDSNPYAAPTVVDLANREQWLHRMRLSIKAQPSKDFRFRGRMSVFKRFGTNTTTPSPQDFSQGRVPSDSTLRMDRFWLDWFVTPKLALSFGRISYSDGSPAELRENLDQPDATWGLTMVDGEYETVDLTFQANRHVLVRGFYAAWAFPRNDDLFSSSLFLNSGTPDLRIIGGNADLKSTDGRMFAQLGAYFVPKFRPFAIPLPNPAFYQDPMANPTNAPPPLDGSLVFPSRLPESLGSYGNVSLFAMARDLAGVDLFAGGALGFLNPNDEAIWYRGFAPDGSEQPVLTLVGSDQGLWTPNGYDVGEAADSVTTFLYVGGRWRVPVRSALAPKVGLEFNHGSRYSISFAQSTDLLTNKLAVRGSAVEAYLIQPVTERAFLRLDWTYIDAKYTSGMPGNLAGGTGFFGSPDNPMDPMSAHGGTSPPVNPSGQHLHALAATLHVTL
ncbi:MAG: DUF3373 family protein [Kofleriaceae bacterium]|nr:DUF3373 family protein [Kofleriaceae bacterium]